MQRHNVFLLVFLLILVIIVAHVFARERASREQPAIVGGAFTHRLLPAGRTPHSHLAALSSRGDGTSTDDLGHSHRVRGYEVGPAGPDAHVHDITQYVVEAR
jgi:hypothetical protein